jgi:hypothetical protein
MPKVIPIGLDIPQALFLLGVLLTLWVVLRAHRTPNGWDFFDMLKTEGHADGRKFMFLIVGLSMTWVLFFLAVNDRLTEWYVFAIVAGYVVADGAALVARRFGGDKTSTSSSSSEEHSETKRG